MPFLRYGAIGAFVVGGIGFIAGFFGPQLGIFITGPNQALQRMRMLAARSMLATAAHRTDTPG